MEKNFKRTLVTTALPYANGPVHIGHLAGVYVPADIYTRYLRLKGEDVIMIGGSDEHGVPITIKAKAEGVTPQDIVDRYHNIIKKSFEEFGISFDIYSRLPRFIAKWLPISFGSCTIKVNLSRKSRCNITTRRLTSFSQTGILPGLVRTVATNMPMATNARLAAHR